MRDVVVRNVRLSDAVARADVRMMGGDCATGEALDASGAHVPAHQVSVWVAKVRATTVDGACLAAVGLRGRDVRERVAVAAVVLTCRRW